MSGYSLRSTKPPEKKKIHSISPTTPKNISPDKRLIQDIVNRAEAKHHINSCIMAFSFGFSGDDIDIEDAEVDQQDQQGHGNAIPTADEDAALPKLVEARRHEMGEWVSFAS